MTHIRRNLLILAGIIVSGCATTEPLPTFFTLGPAGDIHSTVKQSVSRPVRVFVNRIILPPSLNRTNIASFRNNQVEYSTSAFWAASLDQAIAQAIALNLSADGVSASGFQTMLPPPTHSEELTIRISQFQGYESGEVVCSGTWELHSAGGNSVIAGRSFAIRRTGWHPGSYPSLAAMLADEVTALSRQIVAALRR
jgi:uncharacterized lipoprotein YmbA